jgi:chemotaxis protein methyltransferase CheR
MLRQNVVPVLRTYPFVNLWVAGCATGEEAYSLAILLTEEGLYERARIFATDFNDEALAKAREGIYPLDRIRLFTQNYQESGGTRPFSDYCHARYDAMAVSSALKRHITFANHNLVTDAVFGEMHLILCRNVLIYFDRGLQDRVLNLFYESLAHRGYLCLGAAEILRFSSVQDSFEALDEKTRIYRKRRPGSTATP